MPAHPFAAKVSILKSLYLKFLNMFTILYIGILAINFSTFLHGAYGGEEIIFDIVSGNNQKIINIYGNSSNVITVRNIPSHFAFLLFGTHSHVYNVTLSETEETCPQCSITGKNIGMMYKLSTWESEAQMWLINKLQKNFSVLIIISGIDSYGPVPGACNMEFPTENAPYLRLKTDAGKIYLEYQHANIGAYRDGLFPSCSVSIQYITYDVYVSYLKENNFGEDEYFKKISSMSNTSLIKQISNKVMSYAVHPDTRFSFLMYPNLGVVYNVIAKYTVNGIVKEASYVPISSYGCGKSEFTEYGCNFSYHLEGKALLFLLSMYGFFIAYFGHVFYGSTMFFFGFLSICFVSIILFGRFTNFTKSKILMLSVLCGILGGATWYLVYVWISTSLVSLLLVGFVFGFLLSATILYSPVGNFEINLNDKNYWLLLATGSLLTTVIFLAYPKWLSIFGSSVVGSYVMLLFYDDFIGTRLAYVILNIIKRALSENLEFATNNLPFEIKDAVIYIAWVMISASAILIQSKGLTSMSQNHSKGCLTKLFCCKSSRSNHDHVSDPRRPLCNDSSVYYNTFTN